MLGNFHANNCSTGEYLFLGCIRISLGE
jgi:hypothetical protein